MSVIQGEVISSGSQEYTIDQSLRFEDGSSAYLSRTPSVAGNRATWTFSTWVKRGNLGTAQYILEAGSPSSYGNVRFRFNTDDTITLASYDNVGSYDWAKTSAVYRDVSSWYHLVLLFDVTNTTRSERWKLFVNGTQQNLNIEYNAGYPEYQDYAVSSNVLHTIGNTTNGSSYHDGYLAETHFIDGQALTPDYFGEFDATYGHWKPIKYDGTYGTNGFYLPYKNGADIGKDYSVVIGEELVLNGTFESGVTGWAPAGNATITSENGVAKVVGTTTNYPGIYQDILLEANKTYKVSGSIIQTTYDSYMQLEVFSDETYTTMLNYNRFGSGGVGTYSALLTPTTPYVRLSAFGNITDNITYKYGNFSILEVTSNGNDFTANNLSATDIVLDSPTNNFCTLNPLAIPVDLYMNSYMAEGSLKYGTTGGQTRGEAGYGTINMPSGKYYFEGVISTSGSSNYQFAICIGTKECHYTAIGTKIVNGVSSSYGDTYGNLDVIGCALNIDNSSATFYKNGISQGEITGITFTSYLPFLGILQDNILGAFSSFWIANFGQDSSFAGNKTAQGYTDANGIGDFYYEPPEGYLALCSANLPEPTVVPSEHFDVVTYAGDGSTSRSIGGFDFNPELVWLKSRSDTFYNDFYDIVRGATKVLWSNETLSEGTNVEGLKSFDLNGYTVGNNVGANKLNSTYVAWNWKAGGTAVTNTDGTITSQVSANVDAGFSIVSWTGNGTALSTVGHGLNQAIDLYFVKARTGVTNWAVLGKALNDAAGGGYRYLLLNTTNAWGTASQSYGDSETIELWSDGTNNSNGTDYIAYCFHSVEGYSKIGTYIGNGSTDGVFAYCGFKPKYVMIKRTDSTGHWVIYDTERSTFNLVDDTLAANTSDTEYQGNIYDNIDILANGFKLRDTGSGTNASGGTYLFISFAEHPFKYSTAR